MDVMQNNKMVTDAMHIDNRLFFTLFYDALQFLFMLPLFSANILYVHYTKMKCSFLMMK